MRTIQLLGLAIAMVSPFSLSSATIETNSGKLSSMISQDQFSMTTLSLSGTMDARDFAFISDNLTELVAIDLSQITIESVSVNKPILGGQALFDDNQLPSQAFFGSNLSQITLPANITSIGNGAFASTKIKSIEIPQGVTFIGDFTFADCGMLTDIKFPTSLSTLGSYAFSGCDGISSIDMSNTQITEISNHTFSGCSALQNVTLPNTIDYIGDYAFTATSSLGTISLPNNLKSIGNHSFEHSGIQSIQIPESVNKVGEYAFACCDKLSTATISGNNITFGEGAFFYTTQLNSIDAPLTSLPDYIFTGNENLVITEQLLENVTEIGNFALLDNKSDNITFGKNLTYIGNNGMEGMTRLSEIKAEKLNTNVPELGENVFEGINQSEVVLTVAEKSAKEWKTTPQWNEFKITEATSIVKISDEKTSVKAWFDDKLLNISASHNITDVTVYATSGAIIGKFTPNASTTTFDSSLTSESIIIVVVSTEIEVSTFKLIRK